VVCKIQDDRLEIHCHGGHAAADAILDALESHGCRVVDWTEFPSEDRIERDARLALARARTDAVAAMLMDQQRGALARVLDEVDQSLAVDDLTRARQLLESLMQYERLGCRLTSPWRVAIVGPPNVGKSCLINAIVGFQRAIVFDSPGTTRDVVTASTAIDGWPVDFADTAGIRATDDTIESAGVARSYEQLMLSDLVIIVLDASATVAEEIQALLHDFPNAIVVQNKIDLVPRPVDLGRPTRAASATRGDGLPELLSDISQRLTGQPPPSGTAMPFTPEQFDELRAIQNAIELGDSQLARRALRQFRA
jgi:tRNA modification GTPase